MRVWLQAARPKTLAAALAPVAMGMAIAAGDGVFHFGAALAAMGGAILIQIGTNYANDYFDFLKGADDTKTRLGPTRATSAGLVTPKAMRNAFLVVFALAIAVGAYLVWRAGWPVVAIGLTGVLLGVLYTGGPAPLAYIGLADIVVLIYFGPIAVAGTYFVQALQWSPSALVAGIAPGLLATALLAVNNLRDIEGDRLVHKRTLAVRFGRKFAKIQVLVCLLGACLVPVVLVLGFSAPTAVLSATAVGLLCASPLVRAIGRAPAGHDFQRELAGTAQLLVVFAVVFVIGWLV